MAAIGASELASILEIALPILILLIVWSIIWKGFALWKSARLNQPIWFVAILVINTFGILEILYIFVFSKMFSPSKKKRR